ncbi:probable transaldolase [Roseburia sp. CAG:182]|nr:probable transaldolase [Roseburia sp. CAG:182]
MKFFIDTANVEDIRKANDMGVICGVTTNPSLIAKEGRDFTEVIKEITSIVDGPISGEVKATTTDAEGMIKEGREIAAIHKNMVVKIPMTVEGLKAVKALSMAAEMLLSLMRDGQPAGGNDRILIEPELVIRDSCKSRKNNL